MSEVIIVGGNHHNTLGVVRALGRKNIHPVVILTGNSKGSSISRSKYIKKSFEAIESTSVVDFLLSHYATPGVKHVLIGCHDIIAAIFDENYSRLSKFFYMPYTKNRVMGIYANKEKMRQLAESVGLTTPKSIEIVSSENVDLSAITYPCITKPAASKDGSKRDICICNSIESLREFLALREGRRFQVQQFIDKEFEFQLIGCSIDAGETIVIPGVSKIIRAGNGSNTGFLKYDFISQDFEDTINLSEDFIRATGYSGLFSVEFLRGSDGKDYFMEINFRNDGNAICTTNAGANLPYWWVRKCLGQETEIPQMNHVEYVMPEFIEISSWYTGRISFSTMLADFKLATSYMDYAADDKAPTSGWNRFIVDLIMLSVKKPARKFLKVLKKV